MTTGVTIVNETPATLSPTGQIPDSVCPRCAAPLMVITKRNYQYFTAHPQFIGCTAYPECGFTAILTDEVREKMESKPVIEVEF